MTGRPKNFSQAIDELEEGQTSGNGTFRSKLESEIKNLEAMLNKVKPHIEDLTAKAGDEAKKAKDRVESEVQKNPWAAIGIVGLIFFVLGCLFASRRND